MDVVKKDKKFVDVRTENAEDSTKWRQLIFCGEMLYVATSRGGGSCCPLKKPTKNPASKAL